MDLAPLLIVTFMVSVFTALALSVDRIPEVLGATLAIHTIALVLLDVVEVTTVWEREKAPRVELVQVEVPPPPPKPPDPPKAEAKPEPPAKVPPRAQNTPPPPRPAVRPPPTATEPPKPDAPAQEDPGPAPTVAMPELGQQEGTVAVRVGKRNTGPVGPGGNGKSPGPGSGSGAVAMPAPTPVSVATIKTRAMPKGDYGYIDAGKDYPAEARQLGIEGVIRVRLVVDDKGKVKAAVLLNKLGHGLDELAMDRAKKIEFEPAKDTDDKPVSSVVVWTFNMTLPK